MRKAIVVFAPRMASRATLTFAIFGTGISLPVDGFVLAVAPGIWPNIIRKRTPACYRRIRRRQLRREDGRTFVRRTGSILLINLMWESGIRGITATGTFSMGHRKGRNGWARGERAKGVFRRMRPQPAGQVLPRRGAPIKGRG